MCEPIYDLPQKLDNLFPKETKTTEKDDFDSPGDENSFGVKYEADFFRVLPLLSYKNKNMKRILSIEKNEYLRCRYQKFVAHIPDHYVTICLYKDFYKKVEPVRKMQLNGQFYGIDNKLAPVPYFPDPRLREQPTRSALRK